MPQTAAKSIQSSSCSHHLRLRRYLVWSRLCACSVAHPTLLLRFLSKCETVLRIVCANALSINSTQLHCAPCCKSTCKPLCILLLHRFTRSNRVSYHGLNRNSDVPQNSARASRHFRDYKRVSKLCQAKQNADYLRRILAPRVICISRHSVIVLCVSPAGLRFRYGISGINLLRRRR